MCKLQFESLTSVLVIRNHILQQVFSRFSSPLAAALSALAAGDAQGEAMVKELPGEMMDPQLQNPPSFANEAPALPDAGPQPVLTEQRHLCRRSQQWQLPLSQRVSQGAGDAPMCCWEHGSARTHTRHRAQG